MERKCSNRASDTSTQHPPTASAATSSPTSPTSDSKALASLINRVRKKVNDVGPEQHSLGKCTIFKIPAYIRRLDKQAYEPVVVPIGPFHPVPWRDPAIQEHKWRCVRYLLSRHQDRRQSKLLDKCLLALKELDKDVRSCYSKKFSLNADDMAEIMLLDGCFIIHLLLKHAKKEREEEKTREEVVVVVNEEEKTREEVIVEVDEEEQTGEEVIVEVNEEEKEGREIMGKEKSEGGQASGVGSGKRVRGELYGTKEKMEKLEDFLPKQNMEELKERTFRGPSEAGLFQVRVVLYDLLKLENQIPFFIIQTLFRLLKIREDGDIDILPQRVLDLFCNIQPRQSNSFETTSVNPIHHLLHLFHSSRVFPPPQPPQPPQQKRSQQKGSLDVTGHQWIPSATELRRAGVKFRKKKKETHFFDITFEKGRMEIPALRVSDNTCSLFRNLIAFEVCDPDAMTYVTIYAFFMDCIIDKTKDARLLHLKGILVNRLSTDEALANLFNKLCNQIHYSPDKNYLADLLVKVNQYYNSRLHRWRADLKRDYFNNPWTIISVIAAVLLLLLTIAQGVFAGFTYFHPLQGL